MKNRRQSISTIIKKPIMMVLLASLLLSFGMARVSGETSVPLKNGAARVEDSHLKIQEINLGSIEKSDDLMFYSSYSGSADNYENVHFVKGKNYWVKYKNAFSYNGQSVDMKITISRNTDTISEIVEQVNYIYLVDSSVGDDPNKGGDMPVNSIFLYAATANVADPSHNTWYTNKHVTVTYEFFENGTENRLPVKGLVGLLDIDGSNYLFDNSSNRKLFYTVKGQEHEISGDMETIYEVSSKGVIRNDAQGAVAQGIPYWLDPTLAIELKEEDNGKFDITFDVLSERIKMPILYEPIKYNITYNLDGGTIEEPNPNPTEYEAGQEKAVTKNPTKLGFEFVGWSRSDTEEPTLQDKVVSTDRGDKEFVAKWTPINYQLAYNPNEPAGKKATGTMNNQDVTVRDDNPLSTNAYALEGYKFKGWTTVGGDQETIEYLPTATTVPITTDDIKDESGNAYPENTVVKTLYAQWEPIKYSVQYDPNTPSGKTATGTMTNQTDLTYDEDYNLNKNAYEIEGYEFLGWSTTPGVQDVTHTDEQGFKNLTTEDGGIVTMYAQWEPWKYNIYYDPNGGEGTMGPQTFRYTDESMASLDNTFTRNGYEFMGFEYEINGNKYLIKNSQQFKDILISLGKNGSVTLVAIWKEIPDPVVRTYSLPVTGVE